MHITFLTYLICCPLVFLAGLVDAIGGGGGLISLPAYLLAGLPAHYAIGTNKLSSCCGTTVATVRFIREGLVNWKLAIPSIVAAVIGSSIGARISLLIPEQVLVTILLVVLPVTAFVVLNRHIFHDNVEEAQTDTPKVYVTAILAALIIGFYDGFYGPGTGTFLILFLTALAHMDLKKANGTTKAVNLTTNISALVIFLLHAKVVLPLGIIAGAFNIAGNYIGTKFFDRSGAKSVKMLTIVVIVIFFVKILLEVLP